MRGYIMVPINQRQYPSVHAKILGSYGPGDIVNITDRTYGSDYDGDDLWFKLDNGTFLWSGGVNVERDCSGLIEEDRKQFLFCYRKITLNKPRMDSYDTPEKLYVAYPKLPSSIPELNIQEHTPHVFAENVVRSILNLKSPRKHVIIYIHGYQLISSMKLDIFANFVESYMSHKNNNVAKTIFFSWPAQGPSRKRVDDRSIRAGQEFAELGLFSYFKVLSEKLKEVDCYLNLVVHSFGHQLLNGMLNPDIKDPSKLIPENIFENVFLMAPDISHLAVQSGGALLKNYFRDKKGKDYMYDLSLLKKLSKKINVFYNEDDFLLYVSTKKFVEEGLINNNDEVVKAEVRKYRNLGNYGAKEISEDLKQDGFTYFNIKDLLNTSVTPDLYDFPFQTMKDKIVKHIIKVRNEGDYDGITPGRVLFNNGRFADHHRYLFTCKPVVDKVQDLLGG